MTYVPTPRFAGAWPVLLTPFTPEGEIDWPAYEVMVGWYIERRVGGLFATCLSSEMFNLSDAERVRLASTAASVSGGRVPVVATGSFGGDIDAHVASVRRIGETGVDAVMLLVPEFAETEAALWGYYSSILDRTECFLGLYECPVPRHRLLTPEVVARLAQSGRFLGYKETSSDVSRIAAHCAASAGTPLSVLQANATLLVDARRAGCPGSMCIAAGVVPELVHAILTAPEEEARALLPRLCAVEALTRFGHPASTKILLAERGLPIEATSRSQRGLSAEQTNLLRQAWRFVSPGHA